MFCLELRKYFSYSNHYLLCSHLCIPKCKLNTNTSYLVFPRALSDWRISSIILSAFWKATTLPQPAAIHQYLHKSSLIHWPWTHCKCSYFGPLKYYYKEVPGITIRKRNKSQLCLTNFYNLLNTFYFFGKFINPMHYRSKEYLRKKNHRRREIEDKYW